MTRLRTPEDGKQVLGFDGRVEKGDPQWLASFQDLREGRIVSWSLSPSTTRPLTPPHPALQGYQPSSALHRFDCIYGKEEVVGVGGGGRGLGFQSLSLISLWILFQTVGESLTQAETDL